MKSVCLVLMVLLLSGCSAVPVWETVDDSMLEQPAMWRDQSYVIQIDLPDSAVPMGEMEGIRRYEAGNMEVETCTFLASDINIAVRYLTGFEKDQLTVLELTRFGLPEYRFAWCCQTDEGVRIYKADLIQDQMVYYAVVCSTPEEACLQYEQDVRQVFASFGLSSSCS